MSHPPEGRGKPSWCAICGTREAALRRAGAQHCVFTCERCRTEHFAGLDAPSACMSCRSEKISFTRFIEDAEPVSGMCEPCHASIAASAALFKAGGILFRCRDCGARGEFPAEHEKARQLRLRIPAPGVAGLTLTRDHGCPKCGKP